MSTAMPVNVPAGDGLHPSFVVVGVPVLASGSVPLVGGAGAAVAAVNGNGVPLTMIGTCHADALSIEPVAISSLPVPGAPPEKMPLLTAPELPSDVTTTTPLLTSSSESCASGSSLHEEKALPRLMLTTCAPSLYARSSAAMTMSLSTEPLQPNTR